MFFTHSCWTIKTADVLSLCQRHKIGHKSGGHEVHLLSMFFRKGGDLTHTSTHKSTLEQCKLSLDSVDSTHHSHSFLYSFVSTALFWCSVAGDVQLWINLLVFHRIPKVLNQFLATFPSWFAISIMLKQRPSRRDNRHYGLQATTSGSMLKC